MRKPVTETKTKRKKKEMKDQLIVVEKAQNKNDEQNSVNSKNEKSMEIRKFLGINEIYMPT